MATAPILDISALKEFGAERFGGALTGPWRQGGNAFGALGVLGTTDAFDMTIRAQNVEVFRSTGLTTDLNFGVANGLTRLRGDGTGGIDLTTTNAANLTLVAAGSVSADAFVALLLGTVLVGPKTLGNLLGATQLTLRSGSLGTHMESTGLITLKPGATAAIDIVPRAAAPGNTTRLRFFDFASTAEVSFQAPDVVPAPVHFVWPAADAIAANARAAMITDAAGNLTFGNSIQSGTANIVNGVSAAIPANITAASLIFCQAADVVPGAGNLTIDYRPLAAGRIIGTPGSFTITAVLAAGTINILDQSLGIQWMVLNP